MIWIWVLLGAHIFLSRILPSNFLLSLCPVLVLNPHITQAHSSIFLSCSGAQYMRLFHFLLSLCPVLVLNLCAHQRKEVRIAPQERTMIRSLIQRADKYPFKYWSGFRSTSTSRNQTKMRSTTVSITLRARTHTHTQISVLAVCLERCCLVLRVIFNWKTLLCLSLLEIASQKLPVEPQSCRKSPARNFLCHPMIDL